MLKNKKGYIATTTVLITMAVVMAVTMTVTLLSIGAAQGSMAMNGGEGAWNMTEGCMENALMRVRDSVAYDDGIVTTLQGTCTITITKDGIYWTVTAVPTTSGGYMRSIQVQLTRLGTGITINSWKEI